MINEKEIIELYIKDRDIIQSKKDGKKATVIPPGLKEIMVDEKGEATSGKVGK